MNTKATVRIATKKVKHYADDLEKIKFKIITVNSHNIYNFKQVEHFACRQ